MEYEFRTLMFVKAVTEFGDAWIKFCDAVNAAGMTIDEMKAKDDMDEGIRNFLLSVQPRLDKVITKMKEQRENEDNI